MAEQKMQPSPDDVEHLIEENGVTIHLRITDHGMKAFASIKAAPGIGLHLDVALRLLATKLAKDRINTEVVADMLAASKTDRKHMEEERRVARGSDPVPGRPGKFLHLVKAFTDHGNFSEDEKGRTKFGDLRRFDNITPGMLLARIYPPHPGQDGSSVTGTPLPSGGSAAIDLEIDKESIERRATEGYEELVAVKAGFFEVKGKKVSVQTKLVIDTDLDRTHGDLAFVGEILVRGSVPTGFFVRGDKGVEIIGDVLAARIESSQGEVICHGFVTAGEQGLILGQGVVKTSVLNRAKVESMNDIIIGKEAIDCEIKSAQAVIAETGHLIGGTVVAVKHITAKVIGNEVGARTTLSLLTALEVTPEYQKISLNINNHEHALEVLKMHLGPYAEHPEKILRLVPQYRGKIEELLVKYTAVKKSYDGLLEERKKIVEDQKERPPSWVHAKSEIHSGVRIIAGKAIFDVKESIKKPVWFVYKPAEDVIVIEDKEPTV